jgi:hypothetical protein
MFKHPRVMLEVLKDDTQFYIDHIIQIFAGKGDSDKKLTKNLLRLHVDFLCSHLLSAMSKSQQDQVFWKIIVPYLLLSTTQLRIANAVWERLNSEQEASPCFELLNGCSSLWKDETLTRLPPEERMSRLNMGLTDRIAGEILNA